MGLDGNLRLGATQTHTTHNTQHTTPNTQHPTPTTKKILTNLRRPRPVSDYPYQRSVRHKNCGRIQTDALIQLREETKNIANIVSLFTAESSAHAMAVAASKGATGISGSFSQSDSSSSSQFITFAGCRWIPALAGCKQFRQTCCRDGSIWHPVSLVGSGRELG